MTIIPSDERHRLDAVAVGIANVGGVIALAVLGAQARLAIIGAAIGKPCGAEGIDHLGRAGTAADMRAARRCDPIAAD